MDNEEEDALADHLIEAASIGYGKTRSEVKLITEKVAMEKNVLRKDRVTDGWWHRFKKRQPKLSLRRRDATAHVRMDSTNKKTIDAYYNLLESTLEKHNLKDSPAQIYNMDETVDRSRAIQSLVERSLLEVCCTIKAIAASHGWS